MFNFKKITLSVLFWVTVAIGILAAPFAMAAEVVAAVEPVGLIETIQALWDKIPAWLAVATSIVGFASTITMLTPTDVDNKWVDGALRLLNWISLNIFKNKNADDKSK